MTPSFVVSSEDELGEGISWRVADQSLWWTDILNCRLHKMDWESRDVTTFEVPERLCCFGFVRDSLHRLICGFESGLALFSPDTDKLEWISRPLLDIPGVRMNDGRVDRQGRFWSGSMVEDQGLAPSSTCAALFRLDHDLQVSSQLTGLQISNGLGWSPSGSVMYFADSPLREIRRCEFHSELGKIGSVELHARLSENEFPDGATVDRSGNLWSAVWGGGRIDCYDTSGSRISSIRVPISQPTCVCFGGPDLTTMFVTTARTGIDDEQLAAEPLAGSVLAFDDVGTGIPEPHFILAA